MRLITAPSRTRSARRLCACAVWLLLALTGRAASAGDTAALPRHDHNRIQHMVDALRQQLSIQQEVVVALVASNSRLASVERHADLEGAFLLLLEAPFVDGLSDEELGAVLAHELGHVWIFTHHPFLHTEQLANRIALRVVSRDSLARAYEKMWARMGTTGNLARLLGEATPLAAADPER
jgi:hypothetical protein